MVPRGYKPTGDIAESTRLDAAIDAPLRRRVAEGFIVAVLLTVFLGVASWSGSRRAEEDAYWVSHAHEVMETIQRTTRYVIEAETSARAFALTGQEPLLANYQTAHDKVYRDEDALRRLTADNLSQQRRIDHLQSQVGAALDFADSIIAKRRKVGAYPGGGDAMETERLLDVVRATTRDMYAEEARLVDERTPRIRTGQRLARIFAVLGIVFGVGLWVLAKAAVDREIKVSEQARTQLSVLNAELEQRVQQRTAALQAEIAERERTEEARERLAAVVESSDDAIASKSLQGVITSWNRGAEKVFGYSAAEAVGQPMLILMPPERVDEEPDILARIGRGESVEHLETVSVRKDGKRIDVSVTISPIRDGSGTIVGASKIFRDITEHKRAEEALREQASVLDSAQVFVRDMESRVVFWPRGAEKLYGFTSQEALGVLSHDLFHTKFPEPLEMVEKKLFETGMWEGELIHARRDGSTIVVSSAWVLDRNSEGQPIRILETNIDITARKWAEERLAGQAEELTRSQQALEAQTLTLQSVLGSIGEGLVAVDSQGKFLLWNAAAERMLANSPTNIAIADWPERFGLYQPDGVTPFPGDELPVVRALNGTVSASEMFVRNGSFPEGAWIEVSGGPRTDNSGMACGAVVAFRDITERKRTSAALAEQSEELSRQAEELARSREALEIQKLMLQSVLDSMEEGLVAADEQGKFIIWNPAAQRILGLGATNLPSSEWTRHYGIYQQDMITPFPPDELPLARAIRGESSSAEMFVRNPELEHGTWIEVSGSPLKDKDGGLRGGVVAFRDITKRAADEQEIRALNNELEQRVATRTAQLEAANKELEAFSYSISHDLRAPLRHIGGFSRILMEDFGPSLPEEAQRHLQRIEQGASRMGQLVDELLNLTRVGRQALALKVTDLNAVVKDVIVMLEPESQGRAVEWKIADLPSVECDPILVRQVFQNLIGNALKYSRKRSPAVIEIGRTEQAGQTVIFVIDNGVGFSMKYADKLFGVFQRLHRAEEFEGTGVGLATVRRIVQKHGGTVWAEAEVDRGSTFFFTLGSAHMSCQQTPRQRTQPPQPEANYECNGGHPVSGRQPGRY